MNVKFEELAEDSRIWIYQSNREFSTEEISEISIGLKTFLESWTSHKKSFKSAFQIKYNRFIIIAVDKDFEVSGCSIDASVGFIQFIEKKYQVDLLDRRNITYKTANTIKFTSLTDFKTLIKSKSINKNTIVFNNLVACAYTTGRIEIMSDGTPWRPVVHIRDVCSAFIAGLEAPSSIVAGRAFNVGIPNGNFTIKDIAEAAQRSVPKSELIFTGEHTDSRTYKVSFNRILTELADYYKPEWNLDRGGKELVDLFDQIQLTERQFRGRETIRLQQLKYLKQTENIDDSFRMVG